MPHLPISEKGDSFGPSAPESAAWRGRPAGRDRGSEPRATVQRFTTGAVTLLGIWILGHSVVKLTNNYFIPSRGSLGSETYGTGTGARPSFGSDWDAGKPIYRTKDASLGWWPCPDSPVPFKDSRELCEHTPWDGIRTWFRRGPYKDNDDDDGPGGHLCSIFEVPLNWLEISKQSLSDGGKKYYDGGDWRDWDGADQVTETTKIFLRMLPAKKGKRQGSLLVNPGGPGGSGSQLVYGKTGRAIWLTTEGRFDVIGFDPRGVNLTTPSIIDAETFYDKAIYGLHNPVSTLTQDPTVLVNLSDPIQFQKERERIGALDSQAKVHAGLIEKFTSENARKAVSTPFVVRDMVAMIDALGEKDGLLNYWGFSYGTILGAYFAAMMPERVGRLVLDGVSHAGDYGATGLRDWGCSSMTDSNKVWDEFFITCAEAGFPRCALAANKTFSSDFKPNKGKHDGKIQKAAAEIRQEVKAFRSTLWKNPLPVPVSQYSPGSLTDEDVDYVIFRILYSPARWQELATAFDDAMHGNGTKLYDMRASERFGELKNPVKARRNATDNVFGIPMLPGSPQNAILCGDAEPFNDIELDDLVHLNNDLRQRSLTGNLWTALLAECRQWHSRPFERYTGPWTTEEGLRPPKNPLLWIGNTWDPVTPLASAIRMAKGFGSESSRVLIHDGHGHCTTAEPSLCTIKTIADYLVRGIAPEDGKTCTPEPGFIFPEEKKKDAVVESTDEEENDSRGPARSAADLELLRAFVEASEELL